MVLAVAAVVSEQWQYQLLQNVKQGQKISMVVANANDTREQVIVLSYLAALLLTVIFFMMWIHRAYRNLNTFTGERSQYTPGWAVGYYFIPFLNLVRGYQVMREIWDKSEIYGQERGGALVGVWWALWLISGVISRIITAMGQGTHRTVDDLINVTSMLMVGHAFSILPGIAAVIMVWRIDRMQQQKSTESNNPPPLPIPQHLI